MDTPSGEDGSGAVAGPSEEIVENDVSNEPVEEILSAKKQGKQTAAPVDEITDESEGTSQTRETVPSTPSAEDISTNEQGPDYATKDEIAALMDDLDDATLQSSDGHDIYKALSDKSRRIDPLYGDTPHSYELLDLAEPIVQRRWVLGQRAFKLKLKELAGDDLWQVMFAWSLENGAYENWLDGCDPSSRVNIPGIAGGYSTFMNALDSESQVFCDSLLPLGTICSVGHHFSMDPEFLVDHMRGAHVPDLDDYTARVAFFLDRTVCHLDGVAVYCATGDVCVMMRTGGVFTGVSEPALSEARVRVSCSQAVNKKAVLIFKDAGRPLREFPTGEGAIVYIGGSQRSWSLWINATEAAKGVPARTSFMWILAMLLASSGLPEHIENLARQLRDFNDEVTTLRSPEALARLGIFRASVARIRSDHAATYVTMKHWMLTQMLRAFESPFYYGESEEITSYLDMMYNEREQEASELTPILNEISQLIFAQISLELSSAMMEDSKMSIKNGERGTQLTLLAAIYLPLTLATGIFGMNIKEINDGAPQFWWVIIISALLAIPSAVVIAYIFYKSRKDKNDEDEEKGNNGKGGKEA